MNKPPAVWYACLYVRQLPAQALLRFENTPRSQNRTSLRVRAVAVLEGKPPLETVCSCTRAATELGVEAGMTLVEAESFPGLELLRRATHEEVKALALLQDCAAGFTPRLQPAALSTDTEHALVLDLTGTEMLFGPPPQIARKLAEQARALGLVVEIGISRSFHAAVALARAGRGIVMAPDGEEAGSLAGLGLALLPMSEDHRDMLRNWGIHTFGQLAALPEKQLVARMGQTGRQLWLQARGAAPHLFEPVEAPFLLEDFLQLEEPLELLEQVLFCINPILERVIAGARDKALAIATLTITATLEGGAQYSRSIRPAVATCDQSLLLKLVQLDIDAHPPAGGVRSLTVSAQAGPASKVQLGLFSPQLPEPGRLDVTLARLGKLVGEDRVGWAQLENTHQEDCCTLQRFTVRPLKHGAEAGAANCSALRRLRPPAVVSIRLENKRPHWFLYTGKPYTVERSFGPWQTSGAWWSGNLWSAESWDVLARSPLGEMLLCILVHDRVCGSWVLDAVYD